MGIKIDGDYGTMHRILKILAWRYATAQELAEILGVTRQAVYYHLNKLIEWGFVIRDTKECIEAICIDKDWNVCIFEEGIRSFKEVCKPNAYEGNYYVYAANYYIRKLFPSRPYLSNAPLFYLEKVRERVGNSMKTYDIALMASILQFMSAVLWNSRPRGDSYWVRLRWLTPRGIYEGVLKYMTWMEKYNLRTLAPRKRKPRKDYTPSFNKIKWILSKMYDLLLVERLGGDHCPYGVWVPHPSIYVGKPGFHLPHHKHVNAKHRFKSLRLEKE